jgi:hypothetical protein
LRVAVSFQDAICFSALRSATAISPASGTLTKIRPVALYVANAGDGSVRLFLGNLFVPSGHLALGDDADNIRIDVETNQIIVGYGNGALAVLNPAGAKLADISLKGHPESFQLDRVSVAG